MKTCSKCQINQSSECFSKDSSRADGLQRYCKSCIKDYHKQPTPEKQEPKILVFDVETSPILAHVWGLWKNNVGLNQIEKDWHVMSWSAKWLDSNEIMYQDQRDAENIEDDGDILLGIWELLDQADIVVAHNGDKFDVKKINARFILNGMQPPSSYRTVDTLKIAKKRFAFTSNKLAYLTDKLCKKHTKLSHAKYPGHNLWVECLKGNLEAWDEMREYNEVDVLALEELYHILRPWDSTENLKLYQDKSYGDSNCQVCSSDNVIENGYHYTNSAKYQRYRCMDCGHETRGKHNLSPQIMTRKL